MFILHTIHAVDIYNCIYNTYCVYTYVLIDSVIHAYIYIHTCQVLTPHLYSTYCMVCILPIMHMYYYVL